MASADIMCVGSKSVREKFSGIIRQQDVRATEIDKVDMHLSFRPGDIVRASVIDKKTYILLSFFLLPCALGGVLGCPLEMHGHIFFPPAKNELGVVSAESTAGGTMVPISWTEMQCPLTGQIERRKVAKGN
ncbi:exosome complex component CSL4 [Melia azedarach]|uniref:Exosome complex component CSL4 n=1 Tax=Melia azedarach TaxID=155640 RepID=A0ACC1YDQ4_MELAZ|nr:exosome complex component CSL4 [Melia azedarach]